MGVRMQLRFISGFRKWDYSEIITGREDSLPVISEGLFGAARFEKSTLACRDELKDACAVRYPSLPFRNNCEGVVYGIQRTN